MSCYLAPIVDSPFFFSILLYILLNTKTEVCLVTTNLAVERKGSAAGAMTVGLTEWEEKFDPRVKWMAEARNKVGPVNKNQPQVLVEQGIKRLPGKPHLSTPERDPELWSQVILSYWHNSSTPVLMDFVLQFPSVPKNQWGNKGTCL